MKRRQDEDEIHDLFELFEMDTDVRDYFNPIVAEYFEEGDDPFELRLNAESHDKIEKILKDNDKLNDIMA